jgi:hypothetical protein
MHRSASADVQKLMAALADALTAVWSVTPKTTVLSQSSQRFAF